MKKQITFVITLVAATMSLLLSGCFNTDRDIQGTWVDDSGLDIIEIKKVEGMQYTIGNNLSQLKLLREKNELNGLTALGDTVKMVFDGDTAKYYIMGIETTYIRKLSNE